MSINCYTGLQGSGKSYEVVSHVILPGLAKGRRVVTNIDGVDSDLIRAYICERDGIPLEKIGHVIHVSNDQVKSLHFFPCGEHHQSNIKTAKGLVLGIAKEAPLVEPGDLVCIDEAYKFWGTDCKIPEEHKIFFREHRHYTHPETGVACDLVLMTQDIGDLHRLLKVVIELSFRCHKAKALGLNSTYTVIMWESYRQHAKQIVNEWTHQYNPEIFPLYKSYAGEQQGKEVAADNRHNIFKDRRLLFKLAFLVVAVCFASWRVYHFFSDKINPEGVNNQASISPGKPVGQAVPKSIYSPDWRIAGTVVSDGVFRVVLVGAGSIRLEPASRFNGMGYALNGDIDGQRVTRFSGAALAMRDKK